jgi:hypothetical protein
MSRECDVVKDGAACGEPATWFRASPWSKQLVCDAHAAEFRVAPQGGVSRIPMVKLGDLQFTCDWPGESGDGTCGKGAPWAEIHPDGYQRPLCEEHMVACARTGSRIVRMREPNGRLDHAFDPRKVPLKPPPQVPKLLGKQPPPPMEVAAPGGVVMPANPKAERYLKTIEASQAPPSMIPTTPIPPPDPPPHRVKKALFDLAAILLDEAKRKVERWR